MTTHHDLTCHDVQVVEDCGPAGHGYRAECPCGWAGEFHTHEVAAVLDGFDHREVVGVPGEATDRVINALLDLVDDVSEAVIWLADNWTVSLPAPYWYGWASQDDGPALRLLVCCTPVELEQVEALTGEPVTGDSDYRYVVRDFGRVQLRAFTDAEAGT